MLNVNVNVTANVNVAIIHFGLSGDNRLGGGRCESWGRYKKNGGSVG